MELDENEENILIEQQYFDGMDFSDKKSVLEDFFPELEFGDMDESEFNEYFTITENTDTDE
jgi:hypothetical protein